MGFDESNIKKFGFKKSDWNKAAKAYNETLDGGDEGVFNFPPTHTLLASK